MATEAVGAALLPSPTGPDLGGLLGCYAAQQAGIGETLVARVVAAERGRVTARWDRLAEAAPSVPARDHSTDNPHPPLDLAYSPGCRSIDDDDGAWARALQATVGEHGLGPGASTSYQVAGSRLPSIPLL